MAFTIAQYLKNPMGSGSSIAPSDTVKNKYKSEFKEVRSQMNCYWYQVKDDYIAHITIPSKTTQGLVYDVIFEFGNISNATDLKEIPIKVFSNAPSFIFTYAKVFKDQGILIDWLEDKYADKVLKLDANTRNRYKIVSYEKTLYLACLYFESIRSIDVFAKMNALQFSSYDKLKKKIRSERALKNVRNRAHKKAKKAKEKEKETGTTEDLSRDKTNIASSEDNKSDIRSNIHPKKTPTTKTTKSVPKVSNKVKKTKTTKKVKKTKKI